MFFHVPPRFPGVSRAIMLKIDIHTHILPEHIPDWKKRFGYGGFISLDHHKDGCARMVRDDGHFFREVESNCWDPKKRLEECDEANIDVQVLSTIPVMFSYWTEPAHGLEISKILNDGIASIVEKYPKRFVGLGTIPMQNSGLAIKELERCQKIGLKGIQIGSNVNQLNLGEKEFFDVFAACAEYKMSVFVHPWEMMGEKEMQKYWLPWLVGMPAESSRAICSLIFSGVLESLPHLKIAFAHGGGSFPATLGRIEHGFHVRPDLVAIENAVNPRKYLDQIYFDSLVHEPASLRYLLDLAGAEKIALGTDYPFPLGELEPGRLIESMQFDDDVKARLFHGTALEWLGLDKANFEGK